MRKASLRLLLLFALCAAAVVAFGGASATAGSAASQVSLVGTGGPQTGAFVPSGFGDVTQQEFPGVSDNDGASDPYNGIIDRSLSNGVGPGASVNSGQKAKSNPTFNFGFEGLNHYQQRYSRGGNQFSVQPPDQGLCVGNGYGVEAGNDAVHLYSA